MSVAILKPGLLTTPQDLGRRGWTHLGIGRAGAFDTAALRIANALCGNRRGACALEITLLGPTLRFQSEAWIAVTGAPVRLRVDGVEHATWAPIHVPAGSTLELGPIRNGCRSWLAVRGGFDVEPVLGSRSADANARLGPLGGRPLRAGDVLETGSETVPGSCFGPDRRTHVDRANMAPGHPATRWRADPRPWFVDDPNRPLRLLPGRHIDTLAKTSRMHMFSKAFKVNVDSNRAGLRLAGPTLECVAPVEMVSEGCVPGLLQLPPSGQPIAFGPEGPVSGGYPRIGQVAAVDLPRLAQLKPGDTLRFTPCTLDDAVHAFEQRERALIRLEANIAARLSA